MEDIARIGCLATRYSWIAMLHYAEAKNQVDKMMNTDISIDELLLLRNMCEDNVAIVVTFSAMALESFFNDYAARKIGDKFYYENFEMLRPIGKVQMIAKFIFCKELNKGEHLFQLVDGLFKLRNEYVHNKSKDAHGKGMSKEDIFLYEQLPVDSGKDLELIFMYEKEEIKHELKCASDAVESLYEVADFFEKSDESSHAMFILTSANAVGSYDRDERQKIQQVQREFKIPEIIEADEGD